MRKIDTLRAALAAALPELKSNPDRLAIWIENGAAQCCNTSTEAFAFSYKASVVIRDMSTDISVAALAIFRWLKVNQPELLAPSSAGVSFDVDILDNRCADVLFELQLSETVSVTKVAGEPDQLTYLPEPDPLFPDGLGLGDTDPVPALTGLDVAEDRPPWEA